MLALRSLSGCSRGSVRPSISIIETIRSIAADSQTSRLEGVEAASIFRRKCNEDFESWVWSLGEKAPIKPCKALVSVNEPRKPIKSLS